MDIGGTMGRLGKQNEKGVRHGAYGRGGASEEYRNMLDEADNYGSGRKRKLMRPVPRKKFKRQKKLLPIEE